MTLAPFADLLVIAGLLAVARCSIALAGMDAGTALGGMGASRTMAVACLSEPALVLAIFALGLLAGSSNLDVIAAMQQEKRRRLADRRWPRPDQPRCWWRSPMAQAGRRRGRNSRCSARRWRWNSAAATWL